MKEGDLLEVTACGPESNPKESGVYNAKYTNDNTFSQHFFDGKTWGSNVVFWLKPVGKTEEQIQREAFEAGACYEIETINSQRTGNIKLGFDQWRSEYIKQQ